MIFRVSAVGAVSQMAQHHLTKKWSYLVTLWSVKFCVRQFIDLIHAFRDDGQQLI